MATQVILTGYILEESPKLSLVELCDHCHIQEKSMIKLVDHGIISPCKGQTASQWRFESHSLMRANKAPCLQQDLGINLAGIALALELMDEIETLKIALQCNDPVLKKAG
jgi:chaperone modulatory protein CbpM